MSDILNLEPKRLWKHFYSLTQIPRPSKKEEKIIEFMKKFGEDLGLETHVDETGNVVIRKPATPGYENRKGVILQGHLDMVPQKNSDKEFDFEKDPIEPVVDGEWVTANGTTLGSDNGMGVAAAMAVLEADNLEHGPIDAFFTVDEETGMTGAFGLKEGFLEGDILINMDSEDEGELYVGCAGGTDVHVEFSYTEEPVPQGHKAYTLKISGLKGGHSGIDIPLYRANANITLNRFLWHAGRKHGLRLSSFAGGDLRNAIPREATAVVTIPGDKVQETLECLKKFEKEVQNEYSTIDPDLKMAAEETAMPSGIMDVTTQKQLTHAIYAAPNDVMRMSNDMEGLVETSSNMAVVKAEKGSVKIVCLMRSSVESARESLKNKFTALFELAGAKIWFDGEYPGWKPNMKSPILKTMQGTYENMYGKIPEIKAIHAGLECGLIGGVYPHLDMISFGPTIKFPHSPDEKVNIETVQKFWDFLLETLKSVPEKK